MRPMNPTWRRHDWHRFIRHDAHRFLTPAGIAEEKRASEAVRAAHREAHEAAVAAEQEALEQGLLRLRRQLADLKFEVALRRIFHKYSPNQPRVPAGNPDGGQWTDDGGQGGRFRIAQLDGSITDADLPVYYKPGRHHEMPRGVYQKWELRPETRQVFDKATTGPVPPMMLRTTPDGVPQGHFWSGPRGAHFSYNEAVKELSDRFLQTNNIKPENMTPDHARSLLREIRESQDPRIRDYNGAIRSLQRLFRLRTGRGSE